MKILPSLGGIFFAFLIRDFGVGEKADPFVT